MPIIRGAASDFTTYQKNNAQSTAVPFLYSRVGQPPIVWSATSTQALASRVSLRASTNTVASFNIATRGNSTIGSGADQGKSIMFPGVPRYFLD